jgi:hypothetical protein
MGSLPGVRTYADRSPADRSSFRSSWTQPEGAKGAHILEGQVVDLNLKNWTVDVITKFDQKYFLNVQISSPYMHYNRGEGFYAMPDIGAKCHLCIPSDGPPPYVLDFIMAQETISGTDSDAPDGTDGGKGDVTQESTSASFAGGRTRAKPGDIGITNRDGSFIRLHRGGVLQIGATSLAQRVYIPLQNMIIDTSQSYQHHNTGGSINWFVAEGESDTNPPTVSRHTYRLLANDEKATIRVAHGKLSDVITEPNADVRSDLELLGFGGEPTVCEVLVAPGEISANDGSLTDKTRGVSVLRYYFDASGNTLFRTEGSVETRIAKKLRLRVDGDVDIFGKANFSMTFDGVGRVQATKGLDITGAVIRLNGGTKPVATVGSLVTLTLTAPVPIVITAPSPMTGFISVGATMVGIVTSGNPTVLA